MVQWIRIILQNLIFIVSDTLIPIYDDGQPNIDIIKANHFMSRVKCIYVTMNYVHEEYYLISIVIFKMNTTIQPDYIGTKISTILFLERHYSQIQGTQYYYPTNSKHYLCLDLDILCMYLHHIDPYINL